MPRRFNSLGVLIVSIPTNPLSSQKVATSDDEQAQQRPGQLRSSRESPTLLGDIPSYQVVAFLMEPCIPKFPCQRNAAVGGQAIWRTLEFGNFGKLWKWPVGEQRGFELGEFRRGYHQRTEKQPHRVFKKLRRRRIHVRFVFWYFLWRSTYCRKNGRVSQLPS